MSFEIKILGSMACLFSSNLFIIKENPFANNLYSILLLVVFSVFILLTEKRKKNEKGYVSSICFKFSSIIYLIGFFYACIKILIISA